MKLDQIYYTKATPSKRFVAIPNSVNYHLMKKYYPFSLASNERKRPRTDPGLTYGTQLSSLVTSFRPHTPGLLAEPHYEHVQPTASMRLQPTKRGEACSLLSSLRLANRIAPPPPNNDVRHDINIIADNSTEIDLQWSDSSETMQLYSTNESSPDESTGQSC
ncbi:hypothetical protein QTG54_003046 [Skeletonema marinoi]|uniref:Uncharacterized protein n=1 Tax=Skeletonema marinoi TaxID=267567 RepID=A0AAD8YH17_9STRA|nr:hypothetical protein QTG54_003046 [Skeletonema marinoi]